MRRCVLRCLDGSVFSEFNAPVGTTWAAYLSAVFASEELRFANILHDGEMIYPSRASVPGGPGSLDLTIVRLVDSRVVRLVVSYHGDASRMQWFHLQQQDVLLHEITAMGLNPETCNIGQVLSAFTRQRHRGGLETAMVGWLLRATAPGPVRRRKLRDFLTPDHSFALPLVVTRSEVCLRQRTFEHHGYASVAVYADEGGGSCCKVVFVVVVVVGSRCACRRAGWCDSFAGMC